MYLKRSEVRLIRVDISGVSKLPLYSYIIHTLFISSLYAETGRGIGSKDQGCRNPVLKEHPSDGGRQARKQVRALKYCGVPEEVSGGGKE